MGLNKPVEGFNMRQVAHIVQFNQFGILYLIAGLLSEGRVIAQSFSYCFRCLGFTQCRPVTLANDE